MSMLMAMATPMDMALPMTKAMAVAMAMLMAYIQNFNIYAYICLHNCMYAFAHT